MFMLFLMIIIGVLLDQWSKYLALRLKGQPDIPLFQGLSLSYVENRGVAFGLLKDFPIVIYIVSVLAILLIIKFLIDYKNILPFSSKIFLSMIISGALGNLLDRIVRGFVVDFISVRFPWGYHFPVFNIADILVVIGCFLFIITSFFNKELRELF